MADQNGASEVTMRAMTLVVALRKRTRSSSRSSTPSKIRREARVFAMERMVGSLRGWRGVGYFVLGAPSAGMSARS